MLGTPLLGTAYGTLLNHPAQRDAALALANAPPYAAPPRAPVLYVKPSNCFNASNQVAMPAGASRLMLAASLGLVFMPHVGVNPASVANAQATDNLDTLAWLQLALDWSLPHGVSNGGFYRPPLKYNAHNGMLGLGSSRAMLAIPLGELSAVGLALQINGSEVLHWQLGSMHRPAAQLLRDVGEFMRFEPLDMLLLGQACLPDGSLPELAVGDTARLYSPTHPALGEIAQTVVAA